MKARVDVVVPCYNYGHVVGACVRSVLDQEGVDARVLIIDDTSTDGSAEVVRTIAESDDRVTAVVHPQNRGHIDTYNEGLLDWASSEYVALLSADDLLVPGALARATGVMDAAPDVGMVYGRSVYFSDESHIPKVTSRHLGTKVWNGRDWIERLCRRGFNVISSPEVVLRTSVQQRVGGYSKELPHAGDLEMWLRVAGVSDIGFVRGVPQAFYRVHTSSMQRSRYSGVLTDLEQRRDVFHAFFDSHPDLRGGSDLRARADRALAQDALRRVCRAYEEDELVERRADELEKFTLDVDPQARDLPDYRAVLRRRRLGSRRCRRTRAFVVRSAWLHLKMRWFHEFAKVVGNMTVDEAAGVEAPLGERVGGALRWSFANSIFIRVTTLAIGVVLARLIAPEQFGVYAAALVVINIVMSISELGVSVALVQHDGDISKMAPTVSTLSWLSGAGLAAVCLLGAPVFANALGAPDATGVIRAMSIAVLVAGGAAVPGAILTRGFRQDLKMFSELIAFGVSTPITLGLAFAGAGPWALAGSQISAHVTAAVSKYVLTKERYWPGFDRAQAKAVLRFGLPLAGSSLLIFVVMNVDYIVVGSVLGPVDLGLYLIAFNLSSWPVNAFSMMIRGVSLAAFSNLRSDEEQFRKSFSRALASLMALTLPACVLLAVLGLPLVRFVYGERWVRAATPLAILTVLGALRVALELAYDYLSAAAKTGWILAIHVIWLACLIPALVVGARLDGLAGIGWGHVVVVVGAVTPAYLFALRRIGISTSAIARPLVRPLVGAGAMAAVAYLCVRWVDSDFWAMAIGGTLSLAVYVPFVWSMRSTNVLKMDGLA